MFNIDDAGKMGLEALPETGMGFQFVEAMVMGELKRLRVFNSEKAIDLSGIELSVSNDPAVVLRNGIRIVELLKSDVRQTIVMSPRSAFVQALEHAYSAPSRVGRRNYVIDAGGGGITKQSRQACEAEGAPRVPSVLRVHT